jgi:hypothetical protein
VDTRTRKKRFCLEGTTTMSTKLLLVVCAVAASANEDSTANFKVQAFAFYQTASDSAIGVVNSIWGNADHGVSDADKEALASLEQEVESLAIKARSLAKRYAVP